MFEKVLVGVDGGAGGRDAIALAERLLGEGGRLELVHICTGMVRPAFAMRQGLAERERADALEMLERERAAAGVEAELVVHPCGSAGRGLHDLAERREAELIVVGSTAHGPLGRVMLGDDTREALNGAPCAVAIATRAYAEHPLPIANVGVGYNDTAESEAALAAARAVAARHRAAVRALRVVGIPTYSLTGIAPPALGEAIDQMVREAAAQMEALEDVDGRAVYGLPGEELAGFGDRVDLLAIGSRSYGPVRRLMVGSTANYLERHARCSLLVLPRTSHP